MLGQASGSHPSKEDKISIWRNDTGATMYKLERIDENYTSISTSNVSAIQWCTSM